MARFVRTALSAAVTLLVVLAVATPAVVAQDDDDFFKELRKKKEREKAAAEGRDPDAEKAPEPAKPKLPPSASGWVSTIQRKWYSEKETDRQLVREAVDKLKEAVGNEDELKKDVIKDFDGFKEKEAGKLIDEAVRASGVSVDRLREVLDEHRPNALKAIMNPAYTEADGCKLQPEVDMACEPLFQVWRDPVSYAVENFGLDLDTPAEKLEKLAGLLGEISEEMGAWPDDHVDAASFMRARGAEILNVKEKDYKTNAGVLEKNEALEGGTLTEEDKRHVRVLNDYRMMLGRGALTINLTLCKACFEHSKYMNQIKQLAHTINGHPFGRTPQERARRAGYAGSIAENILAGAPDGDTAVWLWYKAAEHHRTMIDTHTIIGIGHDDTYWTQNFSGGGKGR